ncbi:MAG TPA: elongation factor Ts [Flavobacteriales bacterium]|nr:elongation factor Ts [Flavobacteriales bacterium]HIO67041.1 elongation factor Ts [Flavobacteriales bacterium]
MSQITASDVNKLRQETGAGMMDCKNALVEAEGDFVKATDLLRKQGQKIAAKRGGREANEGYIIAKTNEDGTMGIVLTLNCETDFVARTEDFQGYANTIADTALSNGVDSIDSLKLVQANGSTVQEGITEMSGKIGEKIELAQYEIIKSELVVAYNHPGNRLATIIGLSKSGDGVAEAGKNVSMQIAAMDPVAIDEEGVDQTIVDREIEIGKEQARESGKPEEMLEKIALGKLGKFFKENTLLNQAYVKDNKKTIRQYLEETDSELKVTSYNRLALG